MKSPDPTPHAKDLSANQSHQRLLFAGLFSIVFLTLCAYGIVTFVNKSKASKATGQAIESTPSPTAFAIVQNAPLAWPAVGQAAIASVEDKQLARSSDSETIRPIASMAKVIAALAIMEKQPLEPGQTGPTYTMTDRDVASMNAYLAQEGSALPIFIGSDITQYQAMQRMLIASDNNMADILVERVFGSKMTYLIYAQDMLQRMGLHHTTVADASGFSTNTVGTPSDMVAIGIAALKQPVIAEIVAQQQAQIPGLPGPITNTNQILGTDGVIGIKTGTTDEAGSCLVFAAQFTAEDGQPKTLVGVIMGETSHATLYSDSKQLLSTAKQYFSD